MSNTITLNVGKLKELLKGRHKNSFVVIDVEKFTQQFDGQEAEIINYIRSGKTYKQAEIDLGYSQHQVCYAMAKFRQTRGEITMIDSLNKKRTKLREEQWQTRI